MVGWAAVVFPDSGCGVQVAIPRANDSLDLSGNDVRAGKLDDCTTDWRLTKLLDKRTSSEFVLAVSRKIEWFIVRKLECYGYALITFQAVIHVRPAFL
jgi:hypothetical protein